MTVAKWKVANMLNKCCRSVAAKDMNNLTDACFEICKTFHLDVTLIDEAFPYFTLPKGDPNDKQKSNWN